MEQITNIAFYLLAIATILGFGIFGVFSYFEKEKRAVRVSAVIAIGGAGVFLFASLLSFEAKVVLLGLLALGFLGLTIMSLLPIGRIEMGNDTPTKRFDERDIMFARARLEPGSADYQAYYDLHPEHKAVDDTTRAKPGLLSSEAKLANNLLFASPKASFRLIEVMREIVEGPVANDKIVLPANQMTHYIKGLGRYYGALEIGITTLNPYHIYSHIGRGPGTYGAPITLDHRFAIAFTVEMAREMVEANPTAPGAMETAKQYVESARVAVQLATAIREMGYEARAHIDGNYRVIAPLVARDAGLGEIGRMGLLMTSKQGPRVRLGVVTTALELVPDKRIPDKAVIDFCTICEKCAQNCPSKSIPFGDRQEIEGVLRWRINSESCFLYWNVMGTDCGICMKVCPYSHPNTAPHNMLRWGIARSGFVRRGALWMDDLFYLKKPEQREAPRWTQVP